MRGTHKPRCPECGLKIRGSAERHREGDDHKRRKAERAAQQKKAS